VWQGLLWCLLALLLYGCVVAAFGSARRPTCADDPACRSAYEAVTPEPVEWP
jgi:hypothetical protein